MEEFEYKEQYKYLTNICLNMTDDCNLCCRYCFVQQHPHYMTYQTAKDSVDWLFKNAQWKSEKFKTDVRPSLTYFGGEPTLMWDKIIKPLTIYIYDKYKGKINLSITTNGTLLSKERIDFLKKYNIQPLLSIDGAPETQNYNRPCKNGKLSFDLIKPNLSYLLQQFPDITFRSTIFQDTVEHTFENYLFAYYLNFKSIFLIPNSREKWSDKKLKILSNEVKKIYNFFIETCEKPNTRIMACSPMSDSFEQVLMHDINVFNNIQSNKMIHKIPDRCGMGTGMGSIGYDGSIYGCQEQDSKGKDNIFYIGNIYENGIDIDKHSILLKQYYNDNNYQCENKNICKYCLLNNICQGFGCPSVSYDLFNKFNIDTEVHCLWLNMLFTNAIRTLQILNDKNNLRFKAYLKAMCNYNNYFMEE